MSGDYVLARYRVTPAPLADQQQGELQLDANQNLKVTLAGDIVIAGVTIADGGDVALGATTDVAKTDYTAAGTLVSFAKGFAKFFTSGIGAYVNLITGQIGITAGAGAVAANTPRVTHASDDPAVASLQLLDNAVAPLASASATATNTLHMGATFLTTLDTWTNGQQGRLVVDNRGGQVVGGHVASGATDLGYPVKVGGVYNSTLPTFTNGQRGDAQVGTRGSLNVALFQTDSTVSAKITTSGSDASTNSNFNGLSTYNYNANFNGTTWDRVVKPNATSRIVSAANTTNATSAKASAGNVSQISGFNAGTISFLKFYNKATAPTVGTDVPVWTGYLPANTAFVFDLPNGGMYFSTGIAYALTLNGADNDNTAVAAAAVLGLNIIYS